MVVRERTKQDADWIVELLQERWGGTTMVVHGQVVDLLRLPALVVERAQGLATYRIQDGDAELMSLDAVYPGKGVGTLLLEALIDQLSQHNVSCLWVTTTNDNLAALRFYQCRGVKLRRLRPGAVDQARLLKPTIPRLGENGIPIRDELDLCRELG
jgi:GNAT superfamily N-acetyltransferase